VQAAVAYEAFLGWFDVTMRHRRPRGGWSRHVGDIGAAKHAFTLACC